MSSVKTRDTLNRSSPPSDLRSSLRAILRDSAPKLARKEDRGEGVVGDVGNEGAVAMLMTILSAQSATILCWPSLSHRSGKPSDARIKNRGEDGDGSSRRRWVISASAEMYGGVWLRTRNSSQGAVS